MNQFRKGKFGEGRAGRWRGGGCSGVSKELHAAIAGGHGGFKVRGAVGRGWWMQWWQRLNRKSCTRRLLGGTTVSR